MFCYKTQRPLKSAWDTDKPLQFRANADKKIWQCVEYADLISSGTSPWFARFPLVACRTPSKKQNRFQLRDFPLSNFGMFADKFKETNELVFGSLLTNGSGKKDASSPYRQDVELVNTSSFPCEGSVALTKQTKRFWALQGAVMKIAPKETSILGVIFTSPISEFCCDTYQR